MNDKRKYIPWIFIPCILALVIQYIASIVVLLAFFAFIDGEIDRDIK